MISASEYTMRFSFVLCELFERNGKLLSLFGTALNDDHILSMSTYKLKAVMLESICFTLFWSIFTVLSLSQCTHTHTCVCKCPKFIEAFRVAFCEAYLSCSAISKGSQIVVSLYCFILCRFNLLFHYLYFQLQIHFSVDSFQVEVIPHYK